MRFLIGIDEAGRGPLAGPVAVGAAMVPSGFDWSRVGGIRDSKQMTPLARERSFKQLQEMRRAGELNFAVAFSSHKMIDTLGITKAVHGAIARALKRLDADPDSCNVFLDGLLHAPEEFRQQTIIGGDDVLPVISIAALAAKVSRDRLMTRLAARYPAYGFDRHKGYGTAAHLAAIEASGLCEIHRRSFCMSAARSSATSDVV